MKIRKASALAAAVLALSLTATACGSDDDSGDNGAGSGGGGEEAQTLTIGIKFDQPGLGLKTEDGTFTGFDVDVATYVAKELGVDAENIEFKESPSPERENMLSRGDVDFIVATYSITDERKEKVSFAGPYFLAHQDLLIRADDSVGSVEEINDLTLCSVSGSTSAQNMKENLAPDADLSEFNTYSECLSGLESGVVDALTTDDAILAGYAAQEQYAGKFKLAGLSLSDENYGIGIPKGDTELQADINAALEKMVEDGSWEQFVEKNFGPSGYEYEPAPEITETS
ncbi:glutamate ABC transporter substrate-binding protein [Streptomyces aidingensis]|uniref:Glutamate transport system substrate-binding protein n=1 Tax=Streptomyces aidingensis TaxID=910347 RepID=A0A1I1U8L9_9ACTN|nr:glutamate ABC transporter substrate-binding protein [Streptomyces aidingensis]SFD64260.1 glutamate transport system substrate-binding protein [Streptomyces aidingensis]